MQVLDSASRAARDLDVGEPARRSRPSLGLIPTVLVVGAAYYLAAVLSLRVALVEGIVTPVWPPTGIAVAALLIFGYRAWPGIMLAAFFVNAPISSPIAVAGGITVGNTLAPLLAVFLLRRAGFRREFDRLRDALALVFLGGLTGMLVSATIGTASLVLWDALPMASAGQTWWVWWTGDAMGVLVFSPLLLGARVPRLPIPWRRWSEATLMFVGLFAVARIVLWSELPILYLVFPFLVFIVLRFRQAGAAVAVLITTTTAVWAAVEAAGPFARESLFHKMLTLQVYNGATALTSFVLAAVLAERDRAREGLARAGAELEERVGSRTRELTRSYERLEAEMVDRELAEVARAELAAIVETSDDAIFSRSNDGTIRTWNAGAERLFGFRRNEIVGRSMMLLARRDHPRGWAALDVAMRRGGYEETILVRKDGSEGDVSLTSSPITDASGRVIGTSIIARDITERKRAEAELRWSLDLLRSTDRERRRLLSRLVSAQEEERHRLAVDIHDDPIQRMTAARIRLQNLRSKLQDPEALEALDRVTENVDGAIRRMRNVLFQLHPRSLDHDGLAAAIRGYLEEWNDELGNVVLDNRFEGELPIETRRIAYRVVVEALANVRKHAHAAGVLVTLKEQRGESEGSGEQDGAAAGPDGSRGIPGVLVRIEDDGAGFDVGAVDEGEPGHLGLVAMRERAQIAGGRLRIESEPGGTVVELWVPMVPVDPPR